MLVCKLPHFFVLTVELYGLAFIKLLQELIVQLLWWELKTEIGALTKKNTRGLASNFFSSAILDERQPLTSERLCLICGLDVR